MWLTINIFHSRTQKSRQRRVGKSYKERKKQIVESRVSKIFLLRKQFITNVLLFGRN